MFDPPPPADGTSRGTSGSCAANAIGTPTAAGSLPIMRWPRRDRSEQRTELLSGPTLPGPAGYPLAQPTPATATTIGDAWACIRCLADAASSIPLYAYRNQADGSRARAGDRTLIASLLARPAAGTTQAGLIGTLVAHLNLWGNAFIGKYRENGQITALSAISPDEMVMELDAGEPVYTYTPHTGQPPQRLTRDDIIHIAGMSVDGFAGLSPVRQARRAIYLSGIMAAHAESFFDNDALPSGIFVLRRFGNVDDQVAALRDALESQHQGQPHRIGVVAGDVDFISMTMPLDDAQFLEQRKLSAVEVARIFRVPPRMIGADPGYTMRYSNSESEAIEFVSFSLRPWLVLIEQAITADDDVCAGGLFVRFQLEELLRADHATRAAFYTAALNPQTGWMTRAEVRERENLEPEPETQNPPLTALPTVHPPDLPVPVPGPDQAPASNGNVSVVQS